MNGLIGHTLGHYRIAEKIGAGGMGEVYRAHDERLGRYVAIKVLSAEVVDDQHRLARFEREAKALAALSHSNILEIFDFDREGDVNYAVTELLEGQTLGQRLTDTDRPLRWHEVREIGAAVADGLGAAHGKGVVHRDIKPSNIFLCVDGRVKILDFGLAATHEAIDSEAETGSIDAPLTREGAVMGTLGYMAPEQVKGGQADHRTDIFALGCVLYEMLAGARAFDGDTTAEIMTAILRDQPTSFVDAGVDVPREVENSVLRCLEKNPERRFQSAMDLAFALRSLSAAPRRGGGAEPSDVAAAGDQPSVAVLPFSNLSADQDQDYFCDGMAEEVINVLAKVRGLRVIARTSAFAFKGKNEDVRDIGSALNVRTIVEGSVRKAGDQLRITAQLIDARSGSHLWSERFDRRLEDVFAIQEEIALAIVEHLQVELLGRERAAVVRRPTDNIDAYQVFLKAWFHWNQLTDKGYERSLECFEEAIRIDPNFASAYVGLATATLSQCWWGELAPVNGLAAARPLVARAFELDDTIPEVHSFAAMIRFFERDWAAAEQGHRKAIALGPNVAEVHGQFAAQLLIMRRFDEALVEARLTQKLDPLSPTWNTWTSSWRVLVGERDEGLKGLEAVMSMHPHHWMPHNFLSFHYALDLRLDDARVEAEKAVELSGLHSSAVTQLACVCYSQGETGRGDEMFKLLRERADATYVPPTFLAWVHLARNEPDEAVKKLERAVLGLDPWLTFHRLMAPPSARLDVRIEALLESVGL
jgi:TolB-like protein/tRNA A-37 threonylcarbamoyl transferase component Bud32/Flp pilus assembly protein TadD